jgi:hypothetical protein
MKRFERCELACLLGIAMVLLDACSLSYHFQGQGQMAMLIPPVRPTVLTGTHSGFLIRVSNARSRPAISDGCEINNDLLQLHWFGNTAEIQLKSSSYFPAPGDERPEEVAPRVYLDSMQRVEEFRDALEHRVVRGAFGPMKPKVSRAQSPKSCRCLRWWHTSSVLGAEQPDLST